MTDYSVSDTNGNNNSSSNNETSEQRTPKIAIIGGGLTGLLTATLLERAYVNSQNSELAPQITVFEKSRSVGRLATRYRTQSQTNKNWQWAFGAQFFTAKSDGFSQFIQPWLESGLLQSWCAKVVELTPANNTFDSNADNKINRDVNNNAHAPDIQEKEQWDSTHARYISTPKMTSWGRALADNLRLTTVQFKTRVAPLSNAQTQAIEQKTADKPTELFDETGASLGCFDWVICTAPNGQAVDLMTDSGFTEQGQICTPKMQACYTLMLGWESIEQLPETLKSSATTTATSTWDVAYVQDSLLGRIFIEHQKPNHDQLLPSVTIHARNDWSEAHVDEDIATIQAQLLAAAQQALNWNNDTAPSQIDCHRWRYAATIIDKNAKELGILVDNSHNWIVSGDWCGQGNVESCYLMAAETVEAIIGAVKR